MDGSLDSEQSVLPYELNRIRKQNTDAPSTGELISVELLLLLQWYCHENEGSIDNSRELCNDSDRALYKALLQRRLLDFGLALDQESDTCICSTALDSHFRPAWSNSILNTHVESNDPLWKFRIQRSANQHTRHLTRSLLIGLTTRATYSLTAVRPVRQSSTSLVFGATSRTIH